MREAPSARLRRLTRSQLRADRNRHRLRLVAQERGARHGCRSHQNAHHERRDLAHSHRNHRRGAAGRHTQGGRHPQRQGLDAVFHNLAPRALAGRGPPETGVHLAGVLQLNGTPLVDPCAPQRCACTDWNCCCNLLCNSLNVIGSVLEGLRSTSHSARHGSLRLSLYEVPDEHIVSFLPSGFHGAPCPTRILAVGLSDPAKPPSDLPDFVFSGTLLLHS